ncbi:MAG: YcxB family protein [Clostridia bacterium]|nr:YcxB family protein [Clostridia bacterium]
MELKTVRTKNDILEFNLKVVRKTMLIMFCFAIAIMALGVFEIMSNQKSGEIGYGIFLVAFGILFTPLYYVILLTSLKKNINKNPLMCINWDITYTFGDNEITIVSQSVAGSTQNEKLKWSFVSKCAETKNLIIIHSGNNIGYLINKNTISSEQADAVKNLLISKVGEKICSFKK